MSLINDALKRATKAPSATSNAAESGEPMRPADRHHSVALPRYFFPILLCIFCGAMWFIVQGWNARRQAAIQPDIVRVHARDSGSANAIPTPVDAGTPTEAPVAPPEDNLPIPANRSFALNEEGASNAVNQTLAEAGSAPVTAAPQTLRLQGIFYRRSNPSAVVNAQTVFVGDRVSGAWIKAIDRSSVTLERDGQTQVLTLR